MAHKKAGGSSKNGRDSRSKRRGIKVFGGQIVKPGNIIVRQKGTQYFPGQGVKMGRDYTIYAIEAGTIQYRERRFSKYDGRIFRETVVDVVNA